MKESNCAFTTGRPLPILSWKLYFRARKLEANFYKSEENFKFVRLFLKMLYFCFGTSSLEFVNFSRGGQHSLTCVEKPGQ